MAKLHIDQKTIFELLSNKKTDFLIPDYQRPYSWEDDQCQKLWDDIYEFCLPGGHYDDFDQNQEYFLGCIVTYKNGDRSPSESIDGQQRITTIMLILRAFYDRFANMEDQKSKSIRAKIEKCIWKTDTFGGTDKNALKIDSKVATDDEKEEFLKILRSGEAREGSNSKYALNYKFFSKKIQEFINDAPSFFQYLPAGILDNCILLPIESESEETALRIFSTLNDRGLPLSDSDIFKAKMYRHYEQIGDKEEFIERWKTLEEQTKTLFATGMDELFTRYMYFLRARQGIKDSTTEGLRKFYEKDEYAHLKQQDTLINLESLAAFWESVVEQDKQFSEDILKKLFVLQHAPNGMWQNITSVYFLKHQDQEGRLEESGFGAFLDKITAFIFAHAVTDPGIGALRTPVYAEMVNIIKEQPVSFAGFGKLDQAVRNAFSNYSFTNRRNITRSLLTWHAFTFPKQDLLRRDEKLHIEHIYPKKRQDMEQGLESQASLESLGNKVLLEASINIKAADYRFADKKKIYNGEMCRGKNEQPSKIEAVMELNKYQNFEEADITKRTEQILEAFFTFLRGQGITQQLPKL